MTCVAAFVVKFARLAWALALLAVAGAAVATGFVFRDQHEADRQSRLQTEVERRGIEIMSQTLNGNVMGALSLLAAVDDTIKRDAIGETAPNGPRVSALLETVAQAHDAQGVFVVGREGIVHSSWDSSGKPSTGLNVSFRPYYQMAMQGRDNVYAAVSLARGDRALYFTTPIRSTALRTSPPIGAVVARTGLDRVDELLRGKADIALLLSPQGVVFAGSRADWVGALAAAPTPERIKAIRDLKQFGAMFENREPQPLPFAVAAGVSTFEGRRYAQAMADIRWNDPSGDWRLVLMEDLSRTVPASTFVRPALASGLVMMLVGLLGLKLLHGHHAQAVAARRIEDYGRAQEASAERKSKRAEAAVKLQRARSTAELARIFLTETHHILGTLQGMIYVFEVQGADTMRLAASYACDGRIPDDLEPGQGLLGQCLLDRRMRVLDTTDHESWIIRSGLGNARPAAVMMAPLLLDETALGVVEVAVFDAPDHHAREQFAELAALLALNLEILRRHSSSIEATP